MKTKHGSEQFIIKLNKEIFPCYWRYPFPSQDIRYGCVATSAITFMTIRGFIAVRPITSVKNTFSFKHFITIYISIAFLFWAFFETRKINALCANFTLDIILACFRFYCNAKRCATGNWSANVLIFDLVTTSPAYIWSAISQYYKTSSLIFDYITAKYYQFLQKLLFFFASFLSV